MPTQRISIAKIAGISADIVYEQMKEWESARKADIPGYRSPDQWPNVTREQADAFADEL